MKSLLSVVADSAKVVVWIIDKTDMGYFPDRVLKHVYERIILDKEEDRMFSQIDIDFISEQYLRWEQYKSLLYKKKA